MTEQKFTPGPWQHGLAEFQVCRVFPPNSAAAIAQIYGLPEQTRTDAPEMSEERFVEGLANAHLIAAAPALYAALAEMVDAAEGRPIIANQPRDVRARAALKKAEGGAS